MFILSFIDMDKKSEARVQKTDECRGHDNRKKILEMKTLINRTRFLSVGFLGTTRS